MNCTLKQMVRLPPLPKGIGKKTHTRCSPQHQSIVSVGVSLPKLSQPPQDGGVIGKRGRADLHVVIFFTPLLTYSS